MTTTINFKKSYIRVAILSWSFVLLLILFALFWDHFNLYSDAYTYMAIWLSFLLVFVSLSKWLTFSNKIHRPLDLFELPFYLSIATMFLISLFGIVPFFDNTFLSFRLQNSKELFSGLILIGIGLISLWVGYGITVITYKKGSVRSLRFEKAWLKIKNPSLARTIFLYTVLFILRLILVLLGGGESFASTLNLGVWNQWITYIIETRWFFVALFMLQVLGDKWKFSVLIFVLMAESIVLVLSGWSGNFISLGLLFLGCAFYAKRTIPLKTLLIGVILVILITPIVRSTRDLVRYGSLSIDDALSTSVNDSIRLGVGHTVMSSFGLLFNRQSLVAQTPTIIQKYSPTIIPYRPIGELLLTPLSIIPRVLWPSKPIYTDTYNIVTQEFLGLPASSGSAAPTIIGNAYMYGGYAIVIVGMLILGLIFGLIYKYLVIPALKNKYIAIISLYAGSIIANFHIGEGDFISIWQGIVQRGLVFFLALLIVCIDLRKQT